MSKIPTINILYRTINLLIILAVLTLNTGCIAELMTAKLYNKENYLEIKDKIHLKSNKISIAGESAKKTIQVEYLGENITENTLFSDAAKNSYIIMNCVSKETPTRAHYKDLIKDTERKFTSNYYRFMIISKETSIHNNNIVPNALLGKKEPDSEYVKDYEYRDYDSNPPLCHITGENSTLESISFSNTPVIERKDMSPNYEKTILLQHEHINSKYEHPLLLRIIGTPFTIVIDAVTIVLFLPFIALT